MHHAALVPHLQLDETPDERFVLRDPTQIARLLRRLLDIGAPITASYGNTGDVLHTKLTSISRDERSIYLAWGEAAEAAEAGGVNADVEEAGRVVCMAELDGVRIQFALAIEGSFARAQAFAARLPDSLLRIQRRDYFRLVTPADVGVSCTLPMPRAGDPRRRIAAAVVDISGGGLAFLVPLGTSLAPDTIVEGCVLRLPGAAAISCVLDVRDAFKIVDAPGRLRLRLGCSFVRLPDADVATIQRYIRQAEVERKAREPAERELAAEEARSPPARQRRQ